jgi:hypothetical protein
LLSWSLYHLKSVICHILTCSPARTNLANCSFCYMLSKSLVHVLSWIFASLLHCARVLACSSNHLSTGSTALMCSSARLRIFSSSTGSRAHMFTRITCFSTCSPAHLWSFALLLIFSSSHMFLCSPAQLISLSAHQLTCPSAHITFISPSQVVYDFQNRLSSLSPFFLLPIYHLLTCTFRLFLTS